MTNAGGTPLTAAELTEVAAEIATELARLERGEYGVCQQCGALIPFGRLLVFPEARWCAACGGSRE